MQLQTLKQALADKDQNVKQCGLPYERIHQTTVVSFEWELVPTINALQTDRSNSIHGGKGKACVGIQ